jgi:hypothetical protein
VHADGQRGEGMRNNMKSWTSVVLICCIIWAGAVTAAAPGMPPGAVDLTERFTTTGNADSVLRHRSIMRKGKLADATVLVAPVTVRAGLAGITGRCTLRMLAAPAFNVGDGVEAELHLIQSGEDRKIFSRYFDAGRKAEDRAWFPIEVPLDLSPSREVYLEIQVSGGPQGDLVADWLAIAEVHVVPENRKR